MKMIKSLAISALLITSQQALANTDNWALVFGMSQPLLLNGFNSEINYITDKWVFEYSHGANLDLNASPAELALSEAERVQQLKITVPYSTGGGIGYRFTEVFNLRLEYKEHEYQVKHPSGESINYFVQDLGVGAYFYLRPIKESSLLVVPSIRYWPQLSTNLDHSKHTFSNGDVHEAHTFGVFGNVSVGLSF